MAVTRKKWSTADNNLLRSELSKNSTLNAAFMAVATQTGRSKSAVVQHYLNVKDRLEEHTPANIHVTHRSKWTEEEEQRLIKQVMVFPQNLSKCFLIVSEVIERSPSAVANHWYTVTSKRPDVKCFFTASSKYVSINRKNGEGITSTESIWKRLLRVIKNIC